MELQHTLERINQRLAQIEEIAFRMKAMLATRNMQEMMQFVTTLPKGERVKILDAISGELQKVRDLP